MATRKTATKRATKTKSASPEITAENLFQHLKLLHIRLLNLGASVAIRGGKTPDKAQIVSAANVGIGHEQKNLHVNAIIDVLGRPDLESTEGSQLQIHLEYQAVFEVLTAKAEDFVKFPEPLISAGMLIIWPNFRETVMSITAKMSIPPLILPMFIAGASGVKLGGTELQFIPTEGKPDSDALRKSATPKNRIHGYH